jgi:diguanylate cyclase (GGDEF)-like protein
MHITRSKERNQKTSIGFAHESCNMCSFPILVIEGEKSISRKLKSVLKERHGYATVLASTMSEALLTLHTQPFHIAITDFSLPDAPDGEIIDLLTKHRISTIAMTDSLDKEIRDTILKKGAIDYISKQSVNSIEYAADMAHRIYKYHHKQVLVVDDSLFSRSVLKIALEKLQFNVVTASNGSEALSILSKSPEIQLVLIDYEMPDMNGCDLIHEIRKRFSKEDIAIIGISSRNQSDISAQFLKSGANDFVMKQFSYEEMFCRIIQNLDMLELIRTNRDAAFRDSLTGIHNRRYFFEKGVKLHKHASRNGYAVAAMINVDFFDKIADTYGQNCGERVLIKLANLLTQYFGDYLVARLGCEKFVVLIDGMSLVDALAVFEAFCLSVATTSINHEKIPVCFTVSIGLTDQLGKSIDDFIKVANQLMNIAKSDGHNRVVSKYSV